ncbi:MAG: alkaline phosphatase family protein [Actinobacteria bacterium]|nr:alkaline phosphatase family protein [Actinomycetota bacterium]
MSKRIVMIGVDGMDKVLISKFKKELPTISKIIKRSPTIDVHSVFPPDSDTAWASIYTGLNPARHGVVHFLDPLEKSLIYQTKDTPNKYIKGKTFWDIGGKYGKRFCIILPHLGYPVWQVNGIMIGRSSVNDDVQAYPDDIGNEFDLHRLNTIKGFPGKGGLSHEEFIKRHEELLNATIEFGLKMLRKEDWDLFFIYSSVLDVVPHFFWKYFDESDPAYPGDNPYKDVIRNFYKLHDEMIKKFYSQLDQDDILILLSDHGHGRRPIKNVNINELLKRKNLLFPKKRDVFAIIIEGLKRKTLSIASKYNLENIGSKLLKVIPRLRKIYTTPPTINWENTLAYASDLSGIKSYSYAGIRINKRLIEDEETYEKIRSEIIEALLQISDPATNNKLVKWAMRREELYQGPYIGKYPDIVFELLDDYGVGNRIDAPLIEDAINHGIVPGSHKGDNAVFFMISNEDINIRTNLSLMDVAPTVLDLLGIDWRRFDFDGRSILRR